MKTHGFVFLAPMGLTICASLLYHVTQKMIPRAINPFLSLVITFSALKNTYDPKRGPHGNSVLSR